MRVTEPFDQNQGSYTEQALRKKLRPRNVVACEGQFGLDRKIFVSERNRRHEKGRNNASNNQESRGTKNKNQQTCG